MLYTSRLGIYYFRFPIPPDKHPKGKQSSIRVSLKTRSKKEGLNLAHALSYTGKQLISHLRDDMEYHEIRDILKEHFRQFLQQRQEKIDRYGPLTDSEKLALSSQDLVSLDTVHDREVNRVINAYGIPVKPSDPNYPLVRAEFLKAYSACCQAILKYNGDNSQYDFDGLAAIPLKKQKRLTDVIEEYIADKLRLKQWREHIARDYRGQFNLLVRCVGQDAGLGISEELAREIKNTLIQLPKNASIKPGLKGLTIPELMKVTGHDKLNAVTVSKLLLTYSTFYDWAVKAKYIEANNFKSLVDDVKKVHAERDEFSPEDIKRIFEVALQADKPYQKWGTLIAFYTGARLNEIAQLEVGDIMQQNGIWCFNFSDSGDMQRLKNKASRRVIPIHSHLIELGFMNYVNKAGSGRLFPDLPFHKTAGYGRNLGRWFNGPLLREQLGIKSKALVFHSIRHTVAQRLRKQRVEIETIRDILGHGQQGVTLGVYANNADTDIMSEAIEKLIYIDRV